MDLKQAVAPEVIANRNGMAETQEQEGKILLRWRETHVGEKKHGRCEATHTKSRHRRQNGGSEVNVFVRCP